MGCALVGPISLVESSDGSGSAARSFRGSLYRSCRTQSWKVDLKCIKCFQFEIQANLYITVTLGKWPGDRYIQVSFKLLLEVNE